MGWRDVTRMTHGALPQEVVRGKEAAVITYVYHRQIKIGVGPGTSETEARMTGVSAGEVRE